MMNYNLQKYLEACIFRAGDVAQLTECLISMPRALASIPVPHEPGVVGHTWNPSPQEVGAVRERAQGHPKL